MTAHSNVNVVVLAAGQGKRMYSKLPKVLHRLAGKPLLGHVLDTARQLAPRQLTVVFGHGGDQVRAAFAQAADLTWAHQAEQLGTGHALAQALPFLQGEGTTLMLYGDVPLTRLATLQQLLAASEGGRLGVLTDILDDATGYGRIVRDSSGAVRAIVEQKDCTPEQAAIREMNTGILALPTARLAGWLGELKNDNAQGEYYVTDLIALAVRDGVPIATVHPAHHWEAEGINNKLQLAALERIHQGEVARALLTAGVGLADPARIDVRGTLKHGQDVLIDVNCVFEGEVVLGQGVQIGANCVLKNVTVHDGAEILPFCHLEDAVVGPDSRIGPYARLRPGTRLAEAVHVGNFVEIKQADIGVGSKVNHLSYIGDADVGRGVNIGAGTITCNYDGVNKFRTTIGDNVFIGSNNSLVAPLTLGDGVSTGAGSTLRRSVPAGALAVERGEVVLKEGWQRPIKVAK
ncbi:bifunctional UDP-N-acetylglucosamine diphosphorylase/glucosamine-1-phosphate N-acetyltransferase GlmU [Chitiniphilus purpureus]|uniref:Bifunctional protein GlmU n=1 Tax=Chitiniphilus purpureus TaxID=2981137 RepID=A0ABY6DN85_9NEIS|nr:bifunctional UDP-N-acetylglucosamine diphosphorylase/glucosamine-1-phosphate N-acetyltransferase GlmU [Chitiniphilus sp. CD1]UXY15787.1 bifunctional UDP-N-acetylglucosamine diphosphorylase/glucosamine-1-phosphate N-acetyltransferase GlmU [Chitiniphilus sp. CD1]